MYIADNWGNEYLWYQAECKKWNCKENKARAKGEENNRRGFIEDLYWAESMRWGAYS